MRLPLVVTSVFMETQLTDLWKPLLYGTDFEATDFEANRQFCVKRL